MDNQIQKTNTEISTELHGKIGILQAMTIFNQYKADKDAKLEKGSLSWKPRLYPSVVKTFLLWLSENKFPLSETFLNSYMEYLTNEKSVKRVSTYKTPINKLLGIAKANKFLGFYITNDTESKTVIESKLQTFFEAYLQYGQGFRSERTKQNYRSSFKEFAKFCEAKDLQDFTYIVLKKYETHLRNMVRLGTFESSTMNAYLAPLRQFAKFLVLESDSVYEALPKEEIISIERDLNKILTIGNSKVNNSEHHKASYTYEQVNLIISKCDNSKEKLTIALMYFAGLRVSEAIHVKFSDFNLKDKLLTVIGKGSKKESIDLTYCFEEFKPYLDAYIKDYKPNLEGKLFDNWNSNANVTKFLNPILVHLDLKTIKGKKATAHSFRHSIIQHLILAGNDIYTVQKFARHENISTTERYFKILQVENRKRITVGTMEKITEIE